MSAVLASNKAYAPEHEAGVSKLAISASSDHTLPGLVPGNRQSCHAPQSPACGFWGA